MERRKKRSINALLIKAKLGALISKSPKYEKFVERAKYYVRNPDELNKILTVAYNKATNQNAERTFGEMWGKVKSMFRLIRASLLNEYTDVPKVKVILGLAVILYFVSPFDIFPDFLPFLGFADDLVLFAWFLKYASEEIEKFQVYESKKLNFSKTALFG